MREFSFINAWAMGVRFPSGAVLHHALILLGFGVLLPVILQVLLLWHPTVMLSSADPVMDPAYVTAAGFVLQTGSFFASWRLRFARSENLRGALAFGLLAGLMISVGVGVALFAVAITFGMITANVAAAAVLIAFVALFAIAWTVYAVLFAVATCLLFLLALTAGALIGDLTYAATIVGGSGFVWTLLIAASLVLLWLAARLSCTPVLMAEQRSFNLWAAMGESWRLTWDDEWRITRYLALIGLASAFWIAAILALGRLTLTVSFGSLDNWGIGIASTIVLLLLSAPLAYVSVLVPVGIYRELMPADPDAIEVFA